MKSFIATMVVIGLLIVGFRWAIMEDHKWYRGGGQHKGYITAVDCNQGGLISPYYCRVYFKTELDSSQEDTYYVEMDSPILETLRNAQDNKMNVLVKYDHIIFRGWHYYAGGNQDYISEVK